MAKDTLELGVSGDTGDLDKALGNSVNTFGKNLRRQFESILNDVGGDKFFKGAVSKKWDSIPQYQAHLSGGKAWVTNAYMSGMYKDLKQMGYTSDSPTFQNTLFASGMQQVNTDAMDRYDMLRAYGLDEIAALAHPESDMGKIMERNNRLMQQGWAREFITDSSEEKPVKYIDKNNKERTRKHKNVATGKMEDVTKTVIKADADFEGMRKRAVELGIAHWIDPDKQIKNNLGKKVLDTSASNFAFNDELETLEDIDDVVDDITKKSNKSKKEFEGWHLNLKAALGTLTAIAGIPLAINKVAEATVNKSAEYSKNTLPFYGMGTEDYLKTKNASTALKLGPDTIYNDIGKLASMRAEFKTFGKGLDPIFSSLAGVFNTITETSDPVQAYKDVAQALTDTVKQINSISNDSERADALTQYKMLIDKIGIPSFGEVAGALNQPVFSSKFPNVESLFTLEDNPYYGALDIAKNINAEIEKIKTSIGASYTELANIWEENFGLKFLAWWDKVLKDRVIPYLDVDKHKVDSSVTMLELYGYSAKQVISGNLVSKGWMEDKSQEQLMESTRVASVPTRGLIEPKGGVYNDVFNNYSKVSPIDATPYKNFYKMLKNEAKNEEKNNVTDKRYTKALDWLDTSGFGNILNNNISSTADKAIIALIQKYLQTGDLSKMNDFENKVWAESGALDKVLNNLANSAEMLKNLSDSGIDIRMTLENAYGDNIGSHVFNLLQNQQTVIGNMH